MADKYYNTGNSNKGQKKGSRVEIEENSILGTFKKVGVGLASAIGIKFNARENDDEICDVADFEYQLEDDEVLLLASQNVCVDGDMDQSADVLLLTNKRIVIEYKTGFFNKQQHIDKFELANLKKYQGTPQVKCSKDGDEPVLEMFFTDIHLVFGFTGEESEKKQVACIEKWVRKTCRAAGGDDFVLDVPADHCPHCGAVLEAGTAFCTSCGKRVGEAVSGQASTVNERFCKQCGATLLAGEKFCTGCGAPVEPSSAEEPEKAEKENNPQPGQPAAEKKAKMPIEQQIDLLQKLQSLVDAGILSREEFEAKKKEIL